VARVFTTYRCRPAYSAQVAKAELEYENSLGLPKRTVGKKIELF
jgi:hypothetical protein